jgi:hypothetical protein
MEFCGQASRRFACSFPGHSLYDRLDHRASYTIRAVAKHAERPAVHWLGHLLRWVLCGHAIKKTCITRVSLGACQLVIGSGPTRPALALDVDGGDLLALAPGRSLDQPKRPPCLPDLTYGVILCQYMTRSPRLCVRYPWSRFVPDWGEAAREGTRRPWATAICLKVVLDLAFEGRSWSGT